MYSCSFYSAHTKIIYSPGDPDRPKTGTRCITKTFPAMSNPFAGNVAPHSAASQSATHCHLKAWLASRLAQTCGTFGCRASHQVESCASWLWRGCRIRKNLRHAPQRQFHQVVQLLVPPYTIKLLQTVFPCLLAHLKEMIAGGAAEFSLFGPGHHAAPSL